MFFELIATFAVGIGAAGLALVAGHLSRGRLPRYAAPVVAGIAMLIYAIWSEYTWAERTVNTLPESVEVLVSVEEARFWKPWTYVVPQTTRLMVLDRAGVQTNPAAPSMLLADIYLFGRWAPPVKRPQLVDCVNGARADVSEAALTDPSQAEWMTVGAEDPLIGALCNT
ncbi:hypothetical protein SAMN05443999_11386 [Roseovarius azorensis]|uniref:Uncharacterized protein n=1 Tax=Roseovarius azorensis TaxID=1287727 RepID=A0A1H7VXH3_9RHOB|nr:hypothetical protein [Roseovarius azorensis]SEM13485.1 hypothetical protein SAMN05443999_11386 [Roseovarius azorensis]